MGKPCPRHTAPDHGLRRLYDLLELTIGDEKKILEAGDGYYVAPDVPHGCVCLEAGVLIDTFSPMRQDFLASR